MSEGNDMAGYLPDGCTQRECDEAQPGYWDEPPSEAEELASEIDRLMQTAESGEDWAHICKLETMLIALLSPQQRTDDR
jgi:hypothetical protein